jgi:hypothetical protein
MSGSDAKSSEVSESLNFQTHDRKFNSSQIVTLKFPALILEG